MLSASFLYSGYPDYFCGHSGILLYAYYGHHTTLRDIIDELIEDSTDCETLPDIITTDEVRSALLAMLSSLGLVEYYSGAIAECAAAMDRLTKCPECGVEIDDEDWDDCAKCGHYLYEYEFPVFIVLLTLEKETIHPGFMTCNEYAESTGCKDCSAYDDCDDRED